jgi:hypothetical protein
MAIILRHDGLLVAASSHINFSRIHNMILIRPCDLQNGRARHGMACMMILPALLLGHPDRCGHAPLQALPSPFSPFPPAATVKLQCPTVCQGEGHSLDFMVCCVNRANSLTSLFLCYSRLIVCSSRPVCVSYGRGTRILSADLLCAYQIILLKRHVS